MEINKLNDMNFSYELEGIGKISDKEQDQLFQKAIEFNDYYSFGKILKNNEPTTKVKKWFIENIPYDSLTNYDAIPFIAKLSDIEFKKFIDNLFLKADEERKKNVLGDKSGSDWKITIRSEYLIHFYQKIAPSLSETKMEIFLKKAIDDAFFSNDKGYILSTIIKRGKISKTIIPMLISLNESNIIINLITKFSENLKMLEIIYKSLPSGHTQRTWVLDEIKLLDANHELLGEYYLETNNEKYRPKFITDLFVF